MQRFFSGTVVFDACPYHVDPADVARFEQRQRDHNDAQYPACWSWPVTDDILRRREHVDSVPETGPLGASRWDAALELLRNWQDGRCAICGAQEWGALVTDHDHETGLIRGRLCRPCNSREGHAGQDVPLIARYRERPPTTILNDLRIVYYDPFHGMAQPARHVSEEEKQDAVNRLPWPSPQPPRS
ncbi:endonuclease domain-containing protein [Streptosporangium sp. NPDC048865]|uniref:endonuclease domain-containing protein n=1 Tax=Streptosporangium sp. NPDC048865 TaxID=3155766 RepID=UPI00342474FC